MAIARPGTPCSRIADSTRASRPAGCAANATFAIHTIASAATTERTGRCAIDRSPFESGMRGGQRPRRVLPQAPYAHGQQGQDVDGEEQPGQRAVTAGDEID